MAIGAPVFRRQSLSLPVLQAERGAPVGGVDDPDGERWRGSSAARGYDSRWQLASRGFRRKHPLCVCCQANGRVSTADLVDHIVPHKGDKALFWDRSNWQGLCWKCHRVIKAAIEAQWSRGEVSREALSLNRLLPQFFL